MNNSQKEITTHSTIAETKTDIESRCFIFASEVQVFKKQNHKKPQQRKVSIKEEVIKNKLFTRQSTDISLKRDKTINLNHLVEESKQQRTINLVQGDKQQITINMQIVSALEKIFFKKKRYCFQVLKQFYLFPDETQSSIQSLSIYDPLVFQEEIIHSLVKIMETKLITNKIWAFLNLKIMPLLMAAKKIEQKITRIQQKTFRQHKKQSFNFIKEAAQDAILAIQKADSIKENRSLQINTNYQYNNNKQVQCEIDPKTRTKKNYLSSNQVRQQVRPTIKVAANTEVNQVCVSTARVQTSEEYEIKYGKMKQRNQNHEPKIDRISSPNYSQRKNSFNQVRTNIQTYKTTEQPATTSKIPYSERQSPIQLPNIKQHKKVHSQIKSPRKYNIIHYYERPRQINYHRSLINIKTPIFPADTSCLCRSPCSLCVNICCSYQRCSLVTQSCVSCFSNNNKCCPTTFCEKSQKNDMVNQTRVSDHVKFINESKLAKNIQSKLNDQYELSQLQSRIEYLNFLKNLVKDQEIQQSFKR